jgi:hypothetical protein
LKIGSYLWDMALEVVSKPNQGPIAVLQTSSKCTAHPPECFGGLRFFIGLRLALEPYLRF